MSGGTVVAVCGVLIVILAFVLNLRTWRATGPILVIGGLGLLSLLLGAFMYSMTWVEPDRFTHSRIEWTVGAVSLLTAGVLFLRFALSERKKQKSLTHPEG